MEPIELVELAGGTVSEDQARKLLGYANLLSAWTTKVDLVSSPDMNRILHEHILDSVAAFQIVSRETSGAPYLDIGSGAGLPGVVFSILAEGQKVTLLEPRAKRVEFLKEVRRVLGLKEVVITKGRIEELPAETSKTSAVARAVGSEEGILRLH